MYKLVLRKSNKLEFDDGKGNIIKLEVGKKMAHQVDELTDVMKDLVRNESIFAVEVKESKPKNELPPKQKVDPVPPKKWEQPTQPVKPIVEEKQVEKVEEGTTPTIEEESVDVQPTIETIGETVVDEKTEEPKKSKRGRKPKNN